MGFSMAAPKGNRFWEARSSHGRKPTFATPEDLWAAACEYFTWVDDHPLYETKAFAFQGVVTTEELPKMRAMTNAGLCMFLDIGYQTFCDYEKREGYSEVIQTIKNVIRQQKYTGAAADLLNANIISRDLGLADKQAVESSSVVTQIDVTASPEEAARVYTEMMEGK